MQNALVVSPFATAPLDAGHRRRAWQMTKLLADNGYRVTFLLLAFEDPWYWNHDEAILTQLRQQWPEVIVVYADRRVGLPPVNGPVHHLDEWWDPALETVLVNLAGRRYFDVAVVHNVWLSKAFDFLPATTVKVLETHDLFWKRSEVFARLGKAPEFYVAAEASEVFGVKRADIAVTIQESEGAELVARTGKPVITVPFYDATLEAAARPAHRTGYLSPAKVSFGVVASDNPFNVAGLDALLEELERVVAETFAPVEIVVAGRAGERIVKRAGVKCVGFVETEAGFYDTVDYAIAPVFDGTGFKVKAADALALRAPTLLSGHAAEGVVVDRGLVCETAAAMAAKMAGIAIQRPPIGEALAHVRRTRHELRARTRRGGEQLLAAIAEASRPLVVDLSRASLKDEPLALYCWLSTIRLFGQRMPTVLLLSPEILDLVGKYVPLGVKAMSARSFADDRIWPAVSVIDVFGETDRAALGLSERDAVVYDRRWRRGAPASDERGVLGDMPLTHPNAAWEPAVQALRRKLDKAPVQAFHVPGRRTRIVFTDLPAGLDRVDLDGRTVSVFVPVSDGMKLQTAIFALLEGIVAEVVWAARPSGVTHRVVMEGCGLRGAGFFGLLDTAAKSQGAVIPKFLKELDNRIASAIGDLRNVSDRWNP